MTNIDKLSWIHIKDRKLLMVKPYSKEIYLFPGGKKEEGEGDLTALERELKEELNIKIIKGSAKFIKEFSASAHGKPEGVSVTAKCYSAEFNGILKPRSEIENFAWVTSNLIGTDKSSSLGNLILTYLKANNLID